MFLKSTETVSRTINHGSEVEYKRKSATAIQLTLFEI